MSDHLSYVAELRDIHMQFEDKVVLDGVSLTVNEVDGARFAVNIIPHTLKVTTFGRARQGGKVNLEVDLLARYVARLAKT